MGTNSKLTLAGISSPGVDIQHPAPEPRPSIVAFIWGGKVAPTPMLPYGRTA